MKAAMLDKAKLSDEDGDITKPQSLEKQMSKSARPDSHFFNNDFYYLSYVSIEKKYTSSLTKHYASRSYVEGIEYMVLDRWSKEVHKYHFDSLYEVMEKRTNLMKVDLPRLSLNDIEDMYLLNIRGALHHLNAEVDFINALLLYIRRIVIKNRIEDTQLGVEHYKSALNLIKPTFYTTWIDHKIPYTTIATNKGVLHLNKHNRMLDDNRLGHGNKNLKGIGWTVKDIKRSKAILENIKKTFKHREWMRRLEDYVGVRQ
ncbi:hypothetical protein Tco_1464026 [Tanacetum coccineum]